MYNEVLGAINSVGLDSYFGNLHEPDTSKRALLFDMVEEYRAVVIDDFILKLINRGEIVEDDFEEEEEGMFRLKKSGMHKFIEKYERFINGNKSVNC